jgi:hypothetical protein
MESPIRQKIVTLATRFADEILDTVSLMLAERLQVEGAGGPRRGLSRAGRTPEELGRAVDRITELLARHPDGLRSEKLRSELGFSRAELLRPLAQAIASGRVKKTGERRRTVYALADKARSAAAPARPAARPKAKPKKERPRARSASAGAKRTRKPPARPVEPEAPAKQGG